MYSDSIDIRKGIDPAKSNSSKEFMICNYWRFKHAFEFKDSICKGCHDLPILSVSISHVAVITVKNVDYYCTIHSISKYGAINLLKNSILEDHGYI